MTYTFYHDPGHGWLAVPVDELFNLGIAHLISRYSYLSKNGKTAYLEEDCDAQIFMRHKPGIKIREKYCQGNSRIRYNRSFAL